jgi:hypothetical protein
MATVELAVSALVVAGKAGDEAGGLCGVNNGTFFDRRGPARCLPLLLHPVPQSSQQPLQGYILQQAFACNHGPSMQVSESLLEH